MRICALDCDSVLEPGSMFGSQLRNIQRPAMVGIEIHKPYIDRAWKDPRVRYIHGDAVAVMEAMASKSFDGILISDFLEHLEKPYATLFLQYADRIARKRIWIWIPEGIAPQDKDIYKLGADIHQTHRSTWYAKDLEAVGFDIAVWPNYFKDTMRRCSEATGNAMFGVKELNP